MTAARVSVKKTGLNNPWTPSRVVGTIFATGLFVVLCLVIVFPLFAGLMASFRPGRELVQNGLAINMDFSTMSLSNYQYLFSGNADSVKYFMWYGNSLKLTLSTVILTLLLCYFVAVWRSRTVPKGLLRTFRYC